MFDPKQPTRFQRGEGKTFKVGRMSPTRKASEDAKAIATKYGLEFLPT